MHRITLPNGISIESDEEVNEDVGPNIMEMQDNAMDDDPETGEYDSTEYADDPEDITEEVDNPNPHGTAESYRITLPNGISIESDGEMSDKTVTSEDAEKNDEGDPEEKEKLTEEEIKEAVSEEAFAILENFSVESIIEATQIINVSAMQSRR